MPCCLSSSCSSCRVSSSLHAEMLWTDERVVWVSYYLRVRRIKSIHETIVALFAGAFADLL